MRPLLAIALLSLVAVAFAGCTEDPKRYPNGVPTPSSQSAAATSTGPLVNETNEAPTANLTATPSNGTAPLNVTFGLSGTDADNDTLSWTLEFGDGNQTNGTSLPSSVVHAYATARNYTASLTVSDGSLNRTATAHITVGGGSAPVPPTIEELCPTDPQAVGNEDVGYYATPADSASSPGALWIYEESNGMPGLQRNDATVPTECPIPDTIIF